MTSAYALLRSFKGIASAVALTVFVVFMPSGHTTSDDWRRDNHKDRLWIGTWAAGPQAAGS
jgi:hypothetical protein